MVHSPTIPFTYAAPVNHNEVPLPEIVHGKDLSKSRWPSKEGHPQRNLSPPNTLSRKAEAFDTGQGTVEESNLK
jgi:hypothetical protein